MKNLESIKNEMFGKDQTLDSKAMNAVFAGGATKTKGSKTKFSGNGDSDPPEETVSQENQQIQ